MKIVHRVGFSHKDGVRSILDSLGIKYQTQDLPGVKSALVFFDIAESDPRWRRVEELIRAKGASDIFNTVFTKKELLSAEWVRLVPTFERGYPQPEETWVTNPINYEDHCPECGTFRQTASFRLKKEPNLGKSDFMSLYWTYALFCTPRILSELASHQIRGYEVWDAIIHKTGTPSQRVSQLFIPTIANPGLVRVEDLKRERCSLCKVTKYYPHMRGVMYLKRDALVSDVDIMQTYEWFGSGHAAYREILVSNRFARLILNNGWKGVTLKVVELI